MTSIPFSDDNAFAAEYALGTLDASERNAAEARRTRDPAFDAEVKAWEARLAPLAEQGAEIRPPLDLRSRILGMIDRLALPAEVDASSVVALRRQVRVWRGATGLAAALAAALALWVARTEQTVVPPTQRNFVAVLQQGTAAPSFVVSLDLGRRTMTVVPSATLETSGKSLELWMIDPDHPSPLSLGLLDARAPAHPRLPTASDSAVISRATYAVTLEPLGGAPDGKPTSAPVYVGHLLDASR